MSERIHTVLDLMQLAVAKRQQKTSEALQRRFELVTSVLLVPTLVAGLFGANTALPGGNRWEGFGLMILLMALGGFGSYALLRAIRPHRH